MYIEYEFNGRRKLEWQNKGTFSLYASESDMQKAFLKYPNIEQIRAYRTMSSYCNDEKEDTFQQPTAERLACLGAGCFVQIQRDDQCQWVEINRTEGDELVGILQPALSTPLVNTVPEKTTSTEDQAQVAAEEVRVCKEQITALGCDRYCVC